MNIFKRLTSKLKSKNTASQEAIEQPIGVLSPEYQPVPENFPVYPPWPPQKIIDDMETYRTMITARKFCAPLGESGDNSLYSLYRMYDYLMLDHFMTFRTELQQFWRTREWKVCDIPDPKDPDPARYAVLAGLVLDMVVSYNDRVKLGLTRDQHPLLSGEERRKFQEVPLELRPWETAPEWAHQVPPLQEFLRIPAEDKILADEHDERADPVFLQKKILVIRPPIFFT